MRQRVIIHDKGHEGEVDRVNVLLGSELSGLEHYVEEWQRVE